jgi:surfactin synthase thioesterase subunit
MRLFCFPYAGAGASIFVQWIDGLLPDVEVCPVQLPGRENRIAEPCLTRIDEVADFATEALMPYFDTDFAFFGHSLGALIAYQVAQRLAASTSPQHLIVSGRRAPQILRRDEPTWNLPDPDFKEHLKSLNGTPTEVLDNDELMQLLLPTIRADFYLDETYFHVDNCQKLRCPITVLTGDRDVEVSESNILPWKDLTINEFKVKTLRGDHFFINKNVNLVLKSLANILKVSYIPRNFHAYPVDTQDHNHM